MVRVALRLALQTSVVFAIILTGCGDQPEAAPETQSTAEMQIPLTTHPDTSGAEWEPLFGDDLADAIGATGVWSWEGDSVLTPTEDEAIFTREVYDDYILDLETRFEPRANSGIILHASDTENWITNSVEVQVGDSYRDDPDRETSISEAGSFYGHVAPTRQTIKPSGEWNRFTISARGDSLWVVLNGELVSEIDMSAYTSAETNPDGSEIPEHLTTPLAELPTEGHIGLQGKHAGAPIWFRNLRVKELP